MADFAQLLEEELEEAVEVKNKKSLHRYISLLTETMARKDENRMEHSEFQKELIRIDGRFNQMITEVREGFRRMDERFASLQKNMDQRFESMQKQMDERFRSVDNKFESMQKQMDQRFNRQTAILSMGFLVVTALITIYQFLG